MSHLYDRANSIIACKNSAINDEQLYIWFGKETARVRVTHAVHDVIY